MCKELNEELQRGQRAFEQIAEHAYAMNAGAIEQTVVIQGRIYRIKCEQIASAPSEEIDD